MLKGSSRSPAGAVREDSDLLVLAGAQVQFDGFGALAELVPAVAGVTSSAAIHQIKRTTRTA